MQVAAVIQLSDKKVQDLHTAAKNIIFQSDNASGFYSQELTPFIFNMNNSIHDENKWF